MKNFEYANPKTEAEAIELLAVTNKSTAVLAGGTDLVGLMKQMVVSPQRVVNIADIETMRHIKRDEANNVWVGAAVHLDDFLHSSIADPYPSVKQMILGINSIQLQSQGTLVGELLRRPCCWYFRGGADLLAQEGRMVVEGDNRYHAILGNSGPAKFVSASRLAPALIALGARVRIVGPKPDQEEIVAIESLYQTPNKTGDLETTLVAGQLVTHIIFPPDQGQLSAAYEVRHGEGPDQPMVSAAVSFMLARGIVCEAKIVLGQVAPMPWVARKAASTMIGLRVNEETASMAGERAVVGAMALSQNEYKIDLTKVAVKRAILRAVGMDSGGFESTASESETISLA